ncbi:MAG TPA: PRC-barrel domain-containing protein [Steroidobacteraceae bacterium]
MNSTSKVKVESRVADLAYRRHGWRDQSDNALKLILAAILFGTVLIIVNARPALSQGVALVKVDVAVVANGYRASKLIGNSVTNDKNEKVGTLDDIVIGRNRDLFAVLQVGGFLGIAGQLVAVPYQSLVIDDAGKKIELPGASRDELKKLAQFKYRG